MSDIDKSKEFLKMMWDLNPEAAFLSLLDTLSTINAFIEEEGLMDKAKEYLTKDLEKRGLEVKDPSIHLKSLMTLTQNKDEDNLYT